MARTIYDIEYHEGPWKHELMTEDYGLFFDEASKLLDEKTSPLVAPAFMTALPAFENGDVNIMKVGEITLKSWVSNYEAATNL